MPREAPVTRAIREARGRVIEAVPGATYTVSYARLTRVSIALARDFHETMDCRVIGERKRRRPSDGYGRAEATPSFGRLCPGMTSCQLASASSDNCRGC